VNKASKHKDAAKKFLAFAASLEGAKAIAAIGVVPALQSDDVTAAYFALDGMPTDDLSKQAFAPDDVHLEIAPSDITADVDTILNEEHDLIMVGEKSIDDGIAEMESRVKQDVLD
jgi:multiple sugar transport system substrate-binding protein